MTPRRMGKMGSNMCQIDDAKYNSKFIDFLYKKNLTIENANLNFYLTIIIISYISV